MPLSCAAVGLLCASTATVAAPGGYVGSAVCARCHPQEFRRQSASAHAGALFPAARHPLAAHFPTVQPLRRPPAYQYEFSMADQELRVRVADDRNFLEIPVRWAFGAGRQAVTFVSRIDRDWYLEHEFSYYPAIARMDVTPGHLDRPTRSLPEAAGLMYKALDPDTGIVACFECHSTGPIVSSGPAIEPAEAGVRCEACHGPGALHARSGDRRRISNPARLSPMQLNVLCGRCHRPPEAAGARIDWSFAWNVRHQPSHLSQSACFRKSKGRLSCLTCHQPHDSTERDAAYYNRICQSCHAAAHRQTARTNCIDCHMPMVSPQPPLRFTNHWIGIYGAGSNLKPVSVSRATVLSKISP